MAMSLRAMQRFGRLALVVSGALLGGCALDTDERPGGHTDNALAGEAGEEKDSAEASSTRDATPCTDGVVEECVVRLPTHNGIETCFHGLRLCKDGEWSACGSADELEKQLESGD